MTDCDRLVIETVVGPHVLDEVHDALDRSWVRHGEVPGSIRISMATAVAEISANILQHASDGMPVPLRMEIMVRPHRVTVILSDEGKPAAVDVDAVNMPGERAKQGRGLALASAVLGALSYRRDETCNHWTLVSRRFG